VARLFRTAAEAERIHAEGHLNSLAGVASTADNLKAAIEGETYEFTEMYPPMLERAVAAGHRARTMFGFALKAEAVHAKLYQAALDAVAQGKDLAEARFYLCPFCGNIEFGVPPRNAPSAAHRRRSSSKSRRSWAVSRAGLAALPLHRAASILSINACNRN